MNTNYSYMIIATFNILVIIFTAFYSYRFRKNLDEMHSMMIGMTFGLVSGLVASTLFVVPTGNFLYAVIIGTVVGLAFGVPLGKLGKHLGMMEGIISGPMGGMMGAMLGQMTRPFNIEIFIPFFNIIFLISMIGISYAINCGVNYNTKKKKISENFVYVWFTVSLILVILSILLPFSLQSSSNYSSQESSLPRYLQELTKEEKAETAIRYNGSGQYQEVNLLITSSRYSPNIILAKKDMPLIINVKADTGAGCGREIIFPDFGINKLIRPGGSDIIKINPNKEGTFNFRCSMDMFHGKLIVS
ncbi:cupredoxin domain-containing protein [Candidatus Woesearchaeota archaeon]|nr:cupredoxin domain-containing protein [Candidatus Woesearchaeota archaeon]